MVSRSQLALILLLLACSLAGQTPDSTYFGAQAIKQEPFHITEAEDMIYDGRVAIFKIEILPDSTLGEVIPISIPGEGKLDSLVIESLNEWKFAPATAKGKPVTATLLINVVFVGSIMTDEDEVVSDTTRTLRYMKARLEEKLDDLRERYNNHFSDTRFIYSQENFHLYAPYQTTFHFTRNGFIQTELPIDGTHTLQWMKELYAIPQEDRVYNLRNESYSNPVPVTEAQLGLGDYVMNHAYIHFMKGDVFGVNDVDLDVKYLAYEGEQFTENEEAGDFLSHVTWHTGLGDIYLDNDIINHNIDPGKLKKVYQPTQQEYVRERLWDHSIFWDNHWLDVGYKYQRRSYQNLDLDIDEFDAYYLLHAGDSLFYQQIDVTVQSRDFEHDSWLAEHRLDIGHLHTHADFLREYGYDLRKSMDIAWGDSIAIAVGYKIEGEREAYLDRRYEFRESAMHAGFRMQHELGWLHLDLDWSLLRSEYEAYSRPAVNIIIDQKEKDIYGAALITRMQTRWRKFSFNVTSKVDYRDTDEVIELPEWKLSSALELMYDVGHNNLLKLGVRQLQVSEYTDWRGLPVEYTRVLDGWFGIQITRKFQINLEAYNLTSEDNLFDREAHGVHYNFTVYWQFVN